MVGLRLGLEELELGEHLRDDDRGDDGFNRDYDDGFNRDYLYIIGRFCLFVTFLFIPALLPSPVQSCYDWMKHSIWQKNKLQDTKQIQKNQFTNLNLILQTNNIETKTKKSVNDFCSMRHV